MLKIIVHLQINILQEQVMTVSFRLFTASLFPPSFIWIRIYSTAFSPKRCNWRIDPVEKTVVSMNTLSVEDKEAGYWKKEYIAKRIASVKSALAQVLKLVNPYTGLPAKTKEALRYARFSRSGRRAFMSAADLEEEWWCKLRQSCAWDICALYIVKTYLLIFVCVSVHV